MEVRMEYEKATKRVIDVDLGGGLVAADQLRTLIERIERLEEEKKIIADDIKDVFSEAKANGFDTKAIKAILKIRKKDEADRTEEEMILDAYMKALGMRQPDLFDEAA